MKIFPPIISNSYKFHLVEKTLRGLLNINKRITYQSQSEELDLGKEAEVALLLLEAKAPLLLLEDNV